MWKHDETVNHISECNEPAQKEYKTRLEWAGKRLHRDLCKRLKFDLPDKRYIHKPESVLEHGRYTILRNFEIQTDQLIFVRRPDLVLIKIKWLLLFQQTSD